MAAKHQAKNAIASRQWQVEQLYLQGLPQFVIAERLKVSTATVSSDMTAVSERWRERNGALIDARKLQELAKCDLLEAEAWAAWRRSQEPRQRKRAKNTKSGAGKKQALRTEGELVTEARDGNPRFLERAESAVLLRCRILGLIAHKLEFHTRETLELVEEIVHAPQDLPPVGEAGVVPPE